MLDPVAETTGADSPQTVISLLAGLFVTKPEPLIVSCFPPTKDVVTEGEIDGSAEKVTVTVEGETEAYP